MSTPIQPSRFDKITLDSSVSRCVFVLNGAGGASGAAKAFCLADSHVRSPFGQPISFEAAEAGIHLVQGRGNVLQHWQRQLVAAQEMLIGGGINDLGRCAAVGRLATEPTIQPAPS